MTKFAIITLVFAVAIVFGQAIFADFSILDDAVLVYDNEIVTETSWESVLKAFTTFDPHLYVPLTLLTFQWEYALIGKSPWMFHLTNLILHTINSILCYLLLSHLTKRKLFALIAALFFALHPIQTEAVMWISARKDLLSGLFMFATFLTYLQFIRSNKKYWWTLSIATTFLALLSKPTAVVLPLLLALFDFKERQTMHDTWWKSLIPHFLLSGVFLAIGMIGKGPNLQNLPEFWLAILSARSILSLLGRLIYPHNFVVSNVYTNELSLLSPDLLLSVLIIGISCIVAFMTIHKTRAIFFGWFFFLLTLATLPGALVQNDIQGNAHVLLASNRYIYTAFFGLCFLLVTALQYLDTRRHHLLISIVAFLLIPLGWNAHREATLWKSSITYFSEEVQRKPDSHITHLLLGLAHIVYGDAEDAEDPLKRSIQIFPMAHNHMWLGVSYNYQGKKEAAKAELEKSLAIAPHFGDAKEKLERIEKTQQND